VPLQSQPDWPPQAECGLPVGSEPLRIGSYSSGQQCNSSARSLQQLQLRSRAVASSGKQWQAVGSSGKQWPPLSGKHCQSTADSRAAEQPL
jgi:hypothetical protein